GSRSHRADSTRGGRRPHRGRRLRRPRARPQAACKLILLAGTLLALRIIIDARLPHRWAGWTGDGGWLMVTRGELVTSFELRDRRCEMGEHRAKIEWRRESADFAYENYNRDFVVEFDNGLKLEASAAPDYKGSPDRVDPEELLVAAVANCHMLTFLA